MPKFLLIAAIALLSCTAFAQSHDDLIKQVQDLMLENYVFLDKAEEINAHLDALMAKDYFDSLNDPDQLAKAITEEMRKITHDKHLGIYVQRMRQADDSEDTHAWQQNLQRYAQPMIVEIKHFDHNIGYFDMRYFGGAEQAYTNVDQVMKRLMNADAIIVDMRKNGGGSPDMARYLTSYFFDKRILLNTIETRATNEIREMWTVDVGSTKLPDVPVFILTSSRTFSGAEDFSYTMQQHNHRATIVGETTGGGAHPTRHFPLEGGFGIGIPYARTVNPVTKTNWEGVGVVPDVKINADDALNKALELAEMAAGEYKQSILAPLSDKFAEITGKNLNAKDTDKIHQLLSRAVEGHVLTENDINLAGYHYLGQGKLRPALAILAGNTRIFPNSVNVYDSYAEALAADGQQDLALKNYEKAVTLAMEQDHRDRELYKENLENFKARMKK